MDKSNLIKNYEKVEHIIESKFKENKKNNQAAFFSLGFSALGGAVISSSSLETALAGGASAILTGLIMASYFFMGKEKNNQTIYIKKLLLDKIYQLMPEEDKNFIDNKLRKNEVINNIQKICEKTLTKETIITPSPKF